MSKRAIKTGRNDHRARVVRHASIAFSVMVVAALISPASIAYSQPSAEKPILETTDTQEETGLTQKANTEYDGVLSLSENQPADTDAETGTLIEASGSSEASPVVSAMGVPVADEVGLKAAIAAAPADGTETVVSVGGDFSLLSSISIESGKNIKIVDDGIARTITVGSSAINLIPAFDVAAGATLTIATSASDNALLTFKGQKESQKYTQLIRCEGTLNWNGGTLEDAFFYGSAFQGHITVSGPNASMRLTEGLFRGNTGGYFSGMITISGGASFVMDGGTLQDNEMDQMPTGASPIYVSSYNSTAQNPTTFTMNGGIVTNNTGATGGGIFIGNTPEEQGKSKGIAKAVINGGTISNNEGTSYGGGIAVAMAADLTLNGGEISGNTSLSMGGGVAVWDYWVGWYEAAYLNAGYSQEQVDGIWKDTWQNISPASFTMNGGAIINNNAPSDPNKNATGTGGGLYAGSGAVFLSAGEISGNVAGKQGGGIYVPASPYTLHLASAIITENDAEKLGGGLWACPTGDVKVFVNNGAALYGNASTGAGNDVASISKEGNWQLHLADRILGGGKATWYDDGAIITSGSLGEPDVGALRYPSTSAREGAVTDTEDDLALHNQTTDVGRAAASSSASLVIQQNFAVRGGGIGTNGSVIIGIEDELTSVSVSKVWEDNNDKAGFRPDAVEVKLLRDGVEIDEATLSNENEWSHTFERLPKHKDGDLESESVYTIEEVEVPGYASETTSEQAEGGLLFTVTNSYLPTPEPVPTPDPTRPDPVPDPELKKAALAKTGDTPFPIVALILAVFSAGGLSLAAASRRK